MTFREFHDLYREGGPGSGTKVSVTGMNAGGQAQAGRHCVRAGKPQTRPVNPGVRAGEQLRGGPRFSHAVSRFRFR